MSRETEDAATGEAKAEVADELAQAIVETIDDFMDEQPEAFRRTVIVLAAIANALASVILENTNREDRPEMIAASKGLVDQLCLAAMEIADETELN
jgi:hypothetical protein